MTQEQLAEVLPSATVTLTAIGLWLSGSHQVRHRLTGWKLALVTQLLLVLFGVLTTYKLFLLHAVVAAVLARNIVHNRHRGGERDR